MTSNFKQWKIKLSTIIKKLEEKKVFHNLGITYQVIWNLCLVFLVFGLMAIFFVGGAGAGFFASLVQDEPLRSYEDMKQDIYNYEELSQIYFADNVYLGELPYELERREVKLEDVSDYLIQAIISTEDEYFYEHKGIVPKALMRATLQELSNSSVQTGGSTLTQQLVKNQILTSEVSFDRKAREILLAMRLEKFFEKEEILEAYLNVVPFGRNASGTNIAGVQAAAQGIFGVDAKDLSLPQAAYIAGLPQSPFGYTPFHGRAQNGRVKDDLTPSINRMKTVLRRMKDSGYITEQEYEYALTYDVKANLTTRLPSTYEEYPYLTNEVLRRSTEILALKMLEDDGYKIDELEAEERVSYLSKYREQARRDLRRSGYKIHTTINKDIYDTMQEAIKDERYFGPIRDGEQEEIGSILIENKTGAIISFVGGRDFQIQELNHATQAYRSNGSTMKPLLAYAPAMDIGAIQPGHIIPDVPTTYTNSEQEVTNFNNRHRGLITVREALQTSQNTTAVKSFRKAPHSKNREALEKMGFGNNLIAGEPFESTSIGAITNGVTVEQNTNAYATFANNGKYIQSYMIERIETKDGEIIFEHKAEPVDVFSPQTSYLIIDMLRDVLRGGTASYLPGRLKFQSDLAGKTGTSQNYHDVWFVGTNPNVTMGVWLGYDTPKPVRTSGVAGLSYSQRTQQIWANLINAAYDVNPELIAPTERFDRPNGIVEQSICGISGLLPSELCQQAGLVKTDLFNANFVPIKVDDSLQRVRYVLIDNEPYVALDTTPEEFTSDGIMIKEEYLLENNLEQFIPEDWGNIIPDRIATDNGKQPDAMSGVSLHENQLRWTKHYEPDIIGYRIYRAISGSDDFQLVSSVRGNTEVHFLVSSSGYAYYVTAVDVIGRESTPSNIVTGEGWKSVQEKEKEKEEEELLEKPKENEQKKEQNKDEKEEDSKNNKNKDEKKKREDEEIPDPLNDSD